MASTVITDLTTAQARLEQAAKAAATAQYHYEQTKHVARTLLYKKKMAGEKLTEEQIRSDSMVQTDALNKKYLETQAELEIARAGFETAKIIAESIKSK